METPFGALSAQTHWCGRTRTALASSRHSHSLTSSPQIRVRERPSARLLGTMSPHRRTPVDTQIGPKPRSLARAVLVGLVVVGVAAASTGLALAAGPPLHSATDAHHHVAPGGRNARSTRSFVGVGVTGARPIDEGLAQVVASA